MIVSLRNKLFDWHILPCEKFSIPVISVGNLSAGGTGKTPHVEYLVRLLQDTYQIATLSRGYGRKSKGFILANEEATSIIIGDEPKQYANKFKKILVAVAEKRSDGIKNLLKLKSVPDLILLDDAFQHRYVQPGLSILLTDYHRLYINDYLIPSGRLREPVSGAKRADIIIVTKTPKIFSPILRRKIIQDFHLQPHQHIFFSYINYYSLIPFNNAAKEIPEGKKKFYTILLFAGIANSYPIQEYLKTFCEELATIQFSDHYQYTRKDLEHIATTFQNIFSKNKIIVTTEKDAMRLKNTSLQEIIVNLPVFYLPIEVVFHKQDKEVFNQLVLEYVRKNKSKC